MAEVSINGANHHCPGVVEHVQCSATEAKTSDHVHHKNNILTKYVLLMSLGLVLRYAYREYRGIMQGAATPRIVTVIVTGFAYEKSCCRALCISKPTNQYVTPSA